MPWRTPAPVFGKSEESREDAPRGPLSCSGCSLCRAFHAAMIRSMSVMLSEASGMRLSANKTEELSPKRHSNSRGSSLQTIRVPCASTLRKHHRKGGIWMRNAFLPVPPARPRKRSHRVVLPMKRFLMWSDAGRGCRRHPGRDGALDCGFDLGSADRNSSACKSRSRTRHN